MKKLTVLLSAVVAFALVSPVFATLGPVHVELNMVKPRLSAARANSLTAFKIHFRYNINIKIREWIKVWFPICESELSGVPVEIPGKICDGLGQITENKPGWRFVPGEEFFKKYPNSELKNYFLLYEIKDYKGNIEFFPLPDLSKFKPWQDIYGNDKSPRLVKDPSGLGCWLLGTILPPMPYDTSDRMERIKTIDRSTSIGWSSCSCQYPLLINDARECSLTIFAPMEFQAWRKGYNSIELNTSKTTGILSPATPGRYYLSIATTPEPVPVESEAFVLPCSDISDVKLEDSSLAQPDTAFRITFNAGEGGALDGGSSTILVKLPKTFVVPKTIPEKSIKFNGSFVSSKMKITPSDDGTLIEMIAPNDVNNFGKAELTFLSNCAINWFQSKKNVTVDVATSSEPNFVTSSPFVHTTNSSVSAYPNGEFQKGSVCFFQQSSGREEIPGRNRHHNRISK